MELELYMPYLSPELIPLAVVVTYPLDHVRTLLHLTQHHYVALPSPTVMGDWHIASQRPSVMGLMGRVVREGGLTALWRGLMPSLIGQSALMWTAVESGGGGE